MPAVSKKNIAIFIALLFHVSGFIGIVFTQYKNWFVLNTPLTLCIMGLLLVWVQEKPGLKFFLFFFICFAAGIVVEIIGVNTSYLFGTYTYGNVMGFKLLKVPLLIGIQWFVTVYCCAIITQNVQRVIEAKVLKETGTLPNLNGKISIQALSLVIDGALLATLFDYTMEPVAQKLGFWIWKDNLIPYFNYTCWFLISAALLWIFRLLNFNKHNQFAIHLFIIQLLFFMALRLYL